MSKRKEGQSTNELDDYRRTEAAAEQAMLDNACANDTINAVHSFSVEKIREALKEIRTQSKADADLYTQQFGQGDTFYGEKVLEQLGKAPTSAEFNGIVKSGQISEKDKKKWLNGEWEIHGEKAHVEEAYKLGVKHGEEKQRFLAKLKL